MGGAELQPWSVVLECEKSEPFLPSFLRLHMQDLGTAVQAFDQTLPPHGCGVWPTRMLANIIQDQPLFLKIPAYEAEKLRYSSMRILRDVNRMLATTVAMQRGCRILAFNTASYSSLFQESYIEVFRASGAAQRYLYHTSQLSRFDRDSHSFRVLLTARQLNSAISHGLSTSYGGHARAYHVTYYVWQAEQA